MSTTITKRITPFFSDDFEILLTIPNVRPATTGSNKIPITAFISKNGPIEPFGCYIYSLADPRTGKVYNTILNNASENLLDVTKRVGTLITKKYNVPSYINISGFVGMDESTSLMKSILDEIEGVWKEVETESEGNE